MRHNIKLLKLWHAIYVVQPTLELRYEVQMECGKLFYICKDGAATAGNIMYSRKLNSMPQMKHIWRCLIGLKHTMTFYY